jgi:hypothetical protein
MIVTTTLDEARQVEPENAARASELQAEALRDLEDLRTGSLRTMGQELHPGLVRIALAGALRALAQEFEDEIAVTVEVDPASDSVGGGGGRRALPNPVRLALYRLARNSVRDLAQAGAAAAAIEVRRNDAGIAMTITGETEEGIPPSRRAARMRSRLRRTAAGSPWITPTPPSGSTRSFRSPRRSREWMNNLRNSLKLKSPGKTRTGAMLRKRRQSRRPRWSRQAARTRS